MMAGGSDVMRGALSVAVVQVVREVLTVGRFAIYIWEMETVGRFFPFFLAFPFLLISGRVQLSFPWFFLWVLSLV